jgi:hypothetical protein
MGRSSELEKNQGKRGSKVRHYEPFLLTIPDIQGRGGGRCREEI